MTDPVSIRGTVVSGSRRAAGFTQLDWVQAQCQETVGFRPYPGTLNVGVAAEDLVRLDAALRDRGSDLIPPGSGACAARLLALQLGSVSGALVRPEKGVRTHGDEIVEVIAPVCLRQSLGLKDGDGVTLILEEGAPAPQGQAEAARPLIRLRGDNRCTFALEALIFDLDGTLIDSVPVYLEIVAAVAQRLALPPVARERIAEAIQDGRFEWARILEVPAERHREELNSRAMAIVQELAPSLFKEKVSLFPGVERLLKTLAGQGVSMGLATSTRRAFLDRKLLSLKEAGLDGVFQSVITTDDVAQPKPAPEPLLACAARLGVAAKACLYVGDTRVDIRAGRLAGMTTVGVLTGFDDYPALKSVTPHLIVESVAALQERLSF